MVNNIPVNGWPQLKDLEAVQPILNRLDKIEDWKRTVKEETFTGDDITIENALALPARSLKTTINAIQDLHGYDNPWAGGAGKNKFNGQYSFQSSSIYSPVQPSTQYTISTKSTGTYQVNMQYIYDDNTFGGDARLCAAGDTSGSMTITTPSNAKGIEIYAANVNPQPQSDIYDTQIELGSTATSFAPYSNICPISGRTAAVLTRSDGDEISEDFTIQLGQTVYGADINWDTGVGTVTWAKIGSITRGAIDSSGKLYSLTFSGISIKPWEERNIPSAYNKCSHFVNEGLDEARITGDKCIVQYYNGLYIGGYVGAENELDALLASGNLDVVCELATPTTIQLTPEQLEMLKGYNHITLSDGYGTIELKALTGANWS